MTHVRTIAFIVGAKMGHLVNSIELVPSSVSCGFHLGRDQAVELQRRQLTASSLKLEVRSSERWVGMFSVRLSGIIVTLAQSLLTVVSLMLTLDYL